MGTIGPVALSSVVLQPSTNPCVKGLNPLQNSYHLIFNLLVEYLFSKKIEVKRTTSHLLKELLKTKAAYAFFISYRNASPDNPVGKYAYPYFACHDVKSLVSTCKFKYNANEIIHPSLWLPENLDHSEWISRLVFTIISSGLTKNNYYECLLPICEKEISFCEKILPYLIHAVLSIGDENVQNIITSGIESFFSQLSIHLQPTLFRSSTQSPTSTDKFNKASVRTMLSVLNYLWLNPKRQSNSRNIWKDLWLDINFLDVAHAAHYCSAYFTAALYTELWCDKIREQARTTDRALEQYSSSGSLESSPLSYLGSQGGDRASLVYDLLLHIYSQIGDSDAVSGCEVIAKDSQGILKHSYLTEKKWEGLLKMGDLNDSKLEILQALQQSQLNLILQGYIQSLEATQDKDLLPDLREYQCESAWRLGKWDLPATESGYRGFQECLYKSQQSVIAENETSFDKFIHEAQQTQFEYLRHTSLEASRNILPVLGHFKMLSVLKDFSKIQSRPECLKEILNSWTLQDEMPYEDFEFVEPISWLKCILLTHQVEEKPGRNIQGRNTIVSEVKKLLENHAARARSELYLEVAYRALHILRKLPINEEEDLARWQVEEAKILGTKKEYSIANKILKSVLHFMEKFALENPSFRIHYGQTLTLRGRWLAETCNENSTVIMRDYLEKATEVLKGLDSDDSQGDWSSAVCDSYLAVARYADAQYQSIINYEKSTAYQTKQVIMANSQKEAKQLRVKNINDDQKKALLIHVRQSEIDQREVRSVEADKKTFLQKAITSYLQCLRGSNDHDLWIFRLISLWFQNMHLEEATHLIKDEILQLPTYKFLPLMYQLAARMGTQAPNIFTKTLLLLIKNITVDHPHHALPVILALNNADKDVVPVKKANDQTKHLQAVEIPAVKERMNTAKQILALLQKTKIGPLVKQYSDLCDAYITLAYLNVDKTAPKADIPNDQPLLRFRNLENIPIITEELKVDRTCQYENIVGIRSFRPEFRLCGGITLPKVIKCVGTDGIEHEQLVKGSDDLRQDAVMQQVFGLVNCLLKQKRETRQRKLRVRTYKVVPVSRRSGVLQWCKGTQVLSQYLVGDKTGAHARYYPNMLSTSDCKRKMMSIAAVTQLSKKRHIYDGICAEFPPVFRYFFLENFPEPAAWFERRQSYTKSVATSSIVGYILGLGDRHVNNILIDKNTAEVVHIDFGIAFEKGRILATPETVPFRLTRDVVDGMGINGVEGTFKRCSEKTLEVMKTSQDVLLTILEVLLYDPLYEWSVPAGNSSQKTSNSSSPSQNVVNTLAERALMRLQQKLQGLEEGVAMSTEGHVNLLVQQARDPNNLCRIYAGWQPYL